MIIYSVKIPDYECNPILGNFETKDLAIEFVRTYYPNYRISQIDKPYITYYDIKKSNGKLTEKDIENDWKSDCFIEEIKILSKMPKIYFEMCINFDEYQNKWYKKSKIFIEGQENISDDYEDILYLKKTILINKNDNKKELFNNYFNKKITENMKNFVVGIELENGDIIKFSTIFLNEKDIIFLKGTPKKLKLYENKLEFMIDENNIKYKINAKKLYIVKNEIIEKIVIDLKL